jgi:hypothetical protein
MSSKSKMRIPGQPRINWKTMVASSKDPHTFAGELQSALQELSNEGYNIVSQISRDGAVIVTGQRVITEGVAFANPPIQPGQAPARRIVQAPTAMPRGTPKEETMYHFFRNGEEIHETFPSMVEALRTVREHISGDGAITPVSLLHVCAMHYDLKSFPALLRVHADALNADKPLG